MTVRQGKSEKFPRCPLPSIIPKRKLKKKCLQAIMDSSIHNLKMKGGVPNGKLYTPFPLTPSFLLAPFTSYFSTGNFYHLVPLGKRNW